MLRTRAPAVSSLLAGSILLLSASCARSPSTAPAPAEQVDDALRLDQIQVVGSHNSYKQAIDASLFSLYEQQRPQAVRGLDYQHLPIAEQLDLGLRGLELDVFNDPDGGRYAQPAGLSWVRDAGLPAGPAYDPEGVMARPGLKVLHVQDLDFRSSCLTLEICLGELRAWSEAHPGHLPVVITVNAKDQKIDRPGFTDPLPFDARGLDELDREILAGLGRQRLIVPDDVRGNRDSLEAAVLDHAWPTLAQARGRFLWVLDETGDKLETYVAGHPGLQDRVLFVNTEPGRPEAAFRILNDPIGDREEIASSVRRGYLVRTRADADTAEARNGDTARRDAAFDSGAQVISTDYYRADPRFGTGYSVELPGGGAGRCNPLTVERTCSFRQ